MDGSTSRAVHSRWLPALVLLLYCGTASAATIPTYTATDLGPATVPLWTVAGPLAVAPGIDIASFSAEQPLSTTQAQAIIATLPPMTNAPVWSPLTYGNPKYAFSYLLPSSTYLSDQGTLLVTNVFGVDGHYSGAGSALLTAQRQADGSFGPLTSLLTSDVSGVSPSSGTPATALGLNHLGQVLAVANQGLALNTYLIDTKSGQTTNLRDVMPAGLYIDRPIALNDAGQILVEAEHPTGNGNYEPHTVLLAPAAVTVPEPTALATLAVGVLVMLARRNGLRPSFS